MKPVPPVSVACHVLGWLLLNAAFTLHCVGADVQSFLVVKGQLFEQTSPGSPVAQGSTPFVFNCEVELRLPGLVTNATVTRPGNVTNALSGECYSWNLETAFADQSAMDTVFGNGDYTLTAFTLQDGVRAPILSLTNNQYPASAPHVANYSAAQSVDPYGDFTLNWDPFPGGTANDVILVQVENESGNTVFETPFFPNPGRLNGLSNSVVIPAFHLPPGQTCEASIIFARGYQTTNNGVYAGVGLTAGYFKRTSFSLITTDSADGTPPQLINVHPAYGETVTVNSSIAFSFDKPMLQRQAISWSSNLDSNKFDYTWTPDLQTVVCVYHTNLPPNTTASWTLNPTNTFCDEFLDLSGNLLDLFGGPGLSGSFTTSDSGAGAKDVVLYGCGKIQVFVQTNSAVASVTNDFLFEAFADLSGIYTITNASLQTPAGAEQALFSDPYDSGDSFGIGQNFPDQMTLDAVFPDGNYVITLHCVHDGTKVATNNLSGTYPSIPRVSNFNAAQAVDPGQNFTLTWDAFVGGTTGDFIQLTVEDDLGNPLFETPGNPTIPGGALNGTNTSAVIPAGTLTPGQAYQARLFFARFVSVNTSSYPGVVGLTFYARETEFGGAAIVAGPILSEPTRISATQFRFRVDGAANQDYTIQVATNLSTANWTSLYITNSPVNPFTVQDSTATNAQRFYRVLVGP